MSTTTYRFYAPVFVTVEDDIVTKVTVDDTTDPRDPIGRKLELAEGRGLAKAVEASLDGQSWPAWDFGF
jgi:hypothetical protein